MTWIITRRVFSALASRTAPVYLNYLVESWHDVRTLDTQQRSYRQVTANTANKQDLVILAHKPTAAFERCFHSQAGSDSGAWAFAGEHLRHLPLPQLVNGRLAVLAERHAYLDQPAQDLDLLRRQIMQKPKGRF